MLCKLFSFVDVVYACLRVTVCFSFFSWLHAERVIDHGTLSRLVGSCLILSTGDVLPLFLEQAEAFARAWGARHVVVEGKHHFDVIDGLSDPESDLIAALLGLK